MTRVLAFLVAFLPLSATAAAQPAPLTAATATWTTDGKVELAVTFEGSACETPGEARVASGDDITDEVTIPTVSTAEVCTMQIVPVSTEQVIEAPEPVIDLDVSALDPENNRVAHGVIEATEGLADCLAPRG